MPLKVLRKKKITSDNKVFDLSVDLSAIKIEYILNIHTCFTRKLIIKKLLRLINLLFVALLNFGKPLIAQ